MVYQVIFVCIISGMVGFKKPILGALAGIVTTLINYFIFYEFDQFLFYVLFLVGGFGGFACSWIIHWVFYGYTDDRNEVVTLSRTHKLRQNARQWRCAL